MQKNLQKSKIKKFFKNADFGKFLKDNNIKLGKERENDSNLNLA
jgi:hypothetical protein